MRSNTQVSWLLSAAVAFGLSSTLAADTLLVPEEYPTIQAALDKAGKGDEVLVAPGTYSGFSLARLPLHDPAVVLRSSGGAEVTTLLGDGINEVITADNSVCGQTIRGFTIKQGGKSGIFSAKGEGYLVIEDCVFIDNSGEKGGAIFMSDATISNCAFINNSASGLGGAIAGVETISGIGLTVTNCTFNANTAGGDGGAIAVHTVHLANILNCTFEGNRGLNGGAIWAAEPQTLVTTIMDCTFEVNAALETGGAIYSRGSTDVFGCSFNGNSAKSHGGALSTETDVVGCTFTSNTSSAGSGGAIWFEGGGNLIDSTLTGNSATNGGAVRTSGGLIERCTFSGNAADYYGGGISAFGGNLTISDCTVFENSAGENGGGMFASPTSVATITDSTFCVNTPDQLVWSVIIAERVILSADDVTTCDELIIAQGACCLEGNCVSTTESSCLAAGGTYEGNLTKCQGVDCDRACVADHNNDDVVDMFDLLELLGAWGSCP